MTSWRTKPWRRTDPRKTVGVPMDGTWEGALLRSSNMITRVRRENPDAADALEIMRERIGRTCPTHGRLEDPIVSLLDGEVAFGCPDCSGEDLRRRWLEEPIEE